MGISVKLFIKKILILMIKNAFIEALTANSTIFLILLIGILCVKFPKTDPLLHINKLKPFSDLVIHLITPCLCLILLFQGFTIKTVGENLPILLIANILSVFGICFGFICINWIFIPVW